jgi:hypothetical protein
MPFAAQGVPETVDQSWFRRASLPGPGRDRAVALYPAPLPAYIARFPLAKP